MIPYSKSFLGLNLIFRINGSPVYRAAIPGLMSLVLFVILKHFYTNDDKYTDHPYGVGVLISSVSFLIIFRANYGYQRYWNACGDVHHMMSKWLDTVTHTAVFHMQQKHYNSIKPPSYFDTHDLNKYGIFRRDRERHLDLSTKSRREQKAIRQVRSISKSISKVSDRSVYAGKVGLEMAESFASQDEAIHDHHFLMGPGRKDGGWGDLFEDGTSTFYKMGDASSWKRGESKGFASTVGGRTPTLFLQELVHLASLCNAVAFSTLRSDIEGTEAPLDLYEAGSPWPEVDPDKLRRGKGAWVAVKDTVRFLFGFDRTPAMRTAHNASRPLPVMGGVSDNEIAFLQRARGPSAKVNLAWSWLSEFIIREHLNGSLGNVAPPIISRLIQFLSDGMIFYNHARKTMFIPFPFPHAQISAFFVFTIMFAVPILMDEYATNSYIGGVLTFLTVTCLAGLHEVSRELENPFRNVPNEIPLVTLQAVFNEALITLYAGYHPDHYWDPDEYRRYGEQIVKDEGSAMTGHSSSSPKEAAVGVNQGRMDKPQSSMEQQQKPVTFAQLEALVAKQQKEIERLSGLIDGSTGCSKKRNGIWNV